MVSGCNTPSSYFRSLRCGIAPRGHTPALLDSFIDGERVVALLGTQVLPPTITVSPGSYGETRMCTLSTPYRHAKVDIWYSLDDTEPLRGSSRQYDNDAFAIGPHVQQISARTYFLTSVPSVVAEWVDSAPDEESSVSSSFSADLQVASWNAITCAAMWIHCVMHFTSLLW